MDIRKLVFLCLLIALVSCESIIDNLDPADVEAVKERLESERAARLLMDNDLKVLMVKVADLERVQDQTNQEQVSQRNEVTRTSGTSVYIRWGRTTCSGNQTTLVYAGYAAGSHYSHSGGASNTLCLPRDPIWNRFQNGNQGWSYIYGAEYELPNSNTIITDDLMQHDVPCAVCEAPRSAMMMVPARNVCHAGWTLEYSGYLVGERYNHAAAADFNCLDEHPERDSAGAADQNGRLFYFVEAQCGSLPCPPYVQGKELTCAVCTK